MVDELNEENYDGRQVNNRVNDGYRQILHCDHVQNESYGAMK